MAQDNPYADVQRDAEALTKARIEAGKSGAVKNDLKIVPIVQATTAADETHKKANTGGVAVSGSPDHGPVESSDGFVDSKPSELESKSSK